MVGFFAARHSSFVLALFVHVCAVCACLALSVPLPVSVPAPYYNHLFEGPYRCRYRYISICMHMGYCKHICTWHYVSYTVLASLPESLFPYSCKELFIPIELQALCTNIVTQTKGDGGSLMQTLWACCGFKEYRFAANKFGHPDHAISGKHLASFPGPFPARPIQMPPWLTDWQTGYLTNWLTDWLTGSLAGWLADWLLDIASWLTDWRETSLKYDMLTRHLTSDYSWLRD